MKSDANDWNFEIIEFNIYFYIMTYKLCQIDNFLKYCHLLTISAKLSLFCVCCTSLYGDCDAVNSSEHFYELV